MINAKKAVGYIRLSRAGPSRIEQEAALKSSGIGDLSSIYFDDTGSKGEKYLQRAKAIESLNAGDLFVIATPSRLGAPRADVLTTLEAIGSRGAELFVCSLGRSFKWTAEALEVVKFAAAAESESASEVATFMRRRKSELGAGSGPKPKLVEGSELYKAALAAWQDDKRSANSVAEEFGVSVPTLHRKFGAKGTPLFGGQKGRKPKSL